MTAQTPDTLLHQSEGYDIVGANGAGLVNARKMGITSFIESSDCWRGFFCTYAVEDGRLCLVEMAVGTGETLAIDGIVPARGDAEYAYYNIYKGLRIEVPFTGGLLAGKGFIRSMYVHMGIQLPFRFEKLLELRFKKGKVTSVVDQSARMADVRRKMSQQRRAWEAAHPSEREELERLDEQTRALRIAFLDGSLDGLSSDEREAKTAAIHTRLDPLQHRQTQLQRLLDFPHSDINEFLWVADSFSLDYMQSGRIIHAMRLYRLWLRSVSAIRRFLRVIKNRGKKQTFKHSSTMSGQIRDTLTHQTERYDIVGLSGAGLIAAQKMGITSFMVSDKCWRGVVCRYTVEEGRLCLVEMIVGRDETLPVEGVVPVVEEKNTVYKGLHIEVPFTGGLLAAREFDDSAAWGTAIWGMQKPFRFEKLLEFRFEAGKVTSTADYSPQIAEKRQKLVDAHQAWETAHRAELDEVERLREQLAALRGKLPYAGILTVDESAAVRTAVNAEILPLQSRLNELSAVVRPPRNTDSFREWAEYSFSLDYKL